MDYELVEKSVLDMLVDVHVARGLEEECRTTRKCSGFYEGFRSRKEQNRCSAGKP